MSSLYVHLDSARAETILGSLADLLKNRRKFYTVIARAQNRTISSMRKAVVQSIRGEYDAPASEIRKTMSVSNSNPRKLVARLSMRGRMSIGLEHYKAKRTPKGVSVKILKGQGAKVIKAGGDKEILETKKNKASATWIAKGRVFARVKDKATPIVLFGPSFLTVLARLEIKSSLQAQAEETFSKRLIHEANYELNKVIK